MIKSLFLVLLIISSFKCSDPDETAACGSFVIIDKELYNSLPVNAGGISISAHTIEDNCLTLTLGYSGCSDGHKIDMITGGDVAESFPVQITFKLKDNDPQSCLAFFTQDYIFDLGSLDVVLSTEPSARLIFPEQGKEILWER